MQAVSSYPTVAARLVALLTDTLPGVNVTRGGLSSVSTNENVFIGGVEKGSHTIPTSRPGRKKRDEQYLLITNINVASSDGPDVAEGRAYELFGELQDALFNDVTLGLQEPTLRCDIDEFESDIFIDDGNAWRCIIVIKIRIMVRLT